MKEARAWRKIFKIDIILKLGAFVSEFEALSDNDLDSSEELAEECALRSKARSSTG